MLRRAGSGAGVCTGLVTVVIVLSLTVRGGTAAGDWAAGCGAGRVRSEWFGVEMARTVPGATQRGWTPDGAPATTGA